MKKYLSAIYTVILISGFVLASCSGTKNNKEATSGVSPNGISMIIEPDTYKAVPEVVKLSIINNTDTVAEYGAYYTIENKQGNDWVEMPFTAEIAFIDILYIQPAGETREYDINLYPDLAEYNIGLYRVRKAVNYGGKRETVTAEFRIK